MLHTYLDCLTVYFDIHIQKDSTHSTCTYTIRTFRTQQTIHTSSSITIIIMIKYMPDVLEKHKEVGGGEAFLDEREKEFACYFSRWHGL